MRLGASAYAYAVLLVLLALSLHGTLEVCRVRPSERMRAAPPLPLPLPLHPPPQAARSAVLAISRGSDFYGVYRYVSSVRRHCPDTEIVIFTDAASLALNPALGPMLDMFGVTIVLVTEDYVPAVARGYHPVSQRWLVVRTWMRARAAAVAAGTAQRIGTLMFSDARDMYFQGNPFDLLAQREGGGQGFYAFVESHDTIGGSEWNFKWVADCFGSEGLKLVEAYPVICAGTSMGSWDDAMAYVELMSSILLEKSSCERNGVDQGMHNYIVYAGVLEKHVSALYKVGNEEGIILNAGIMRALERDTAGRVLALSGKVAAAVHQYDRFPDLQRQFEAANPWLG